MNDGTCGASPRKLEVASKQETIPAQAGDVRHENPHVLDNFGYVP